MCINVLYTYQTAEPFAPLYKDLEAQFPHFNFVLESKTPATDVSAIVSMAAPEEESTPFFMFMVDDMFFFNKVLLPDVCTTLEEHRDCFAFHLKLSPGIHFSHTNNKWMVPPQLQVAAEG